MEHLIFEGFSKDDDELIINTLQAQGSATPWQALSKSLNKIDYVIIQRAFQMGLVKYNEFNHVLLSHRPDGWRSDELDFVITAYAELSVKEISLQLGRTPSSVRKQIYEFGLARSMPRTWSDVELAHLSKIHEIGVCRIAGHCWRSALDVKHQAIKQGFSKEGRALTSFPGRAGNSRFNLGIA